MPALIHELVIANDSPVSGKPPTTFCSLSFKSNGDALTSDDFFYLRDKLLGFLLPYDPTFIFPFNYVNSRQDELMLCFECSPLLKDPIHKYLYLTIKLHLQYQMSCVLEDFDPTSI